MDDNDAGPSVDVGSEASFADEYRSARKTLEGLVHTLQEHERRIVSLPLIADSSPAGGRHSAKPNARALRVETLGVFKVEFEGSSLALELTGRPLAVLKFLVVRRGSPTPREMLLEALWPNVDPAVSTNRLRVAVHALRQQLKQTSENLVEYIDNSYVLNRGGTVALDADEFEACWQHGLRHEESGNITAAVSCYEQAELIYRGEFLSDDRYEDWTMLEREYFKDVYLNVLAKLATHAYAADDFGACMRRCRSILREDVCNEEAYRLLIESHCSLGQPARALRWYEICAEALQRELNSQPSEELISLRERLAPQHGSINPVNAE